MDVGLSIVAVTLLHNSLTPFHSYGSSLLQQQQEQELSRLVSLDMLPIHTVPPKQSTQEENHNREGTERDDSRTRTRTASTALPHSPHEKKIEWATQTTFLVDCGNRGSCCAWPHLSYMVTDLPFFFPRKTDHPLSSQFHYHCHCHCVRREFVTDISNVIQDKKIRGVDSHYDTLDGNPHPTFTTPLPLLCLSLRESTEKRERSKQASKAHTHFLERQRERELRSHALGESL